MDGYDEPSIGTGFHCPPRAKKPPDPRFRLPEQCPCPPATVTVRNPVYKIQHFFLFVLLTFSLKNCFMLVFFKQKEGEKIMI